MSDEYDETVVIFGSLDGVEQLVTARLVDTEWWEVVAAPTLQGVNPGDRFRSRPSNGRLCYAGGFTPGPLRSGTLVLADDPDLFAEQLTLIDALAEEGFLDSDASGFEHQVVVHQSRALEVEAVTKRFHDDAGAHFRWDVEYRPGSVAEKVLVPTSLDALVTTFQALVEETIPTDINPCGHLHTMDANIMLGFTGDVDQDAHAQLPLSLASRLPVDLAAARLVDSRAAMALASLSEPHVLPLAMTTFLYQPDDESEPVLWVSAVLVTNDGSENAETQTSALVELPWDVKGSRLGLDASEGQGVLLWSTNLGGHDESLILSFVEPADGVDEDDPIQLALADAFDDLRSALKDYALMDMIGERDHLRHVLHSRH